jgi:hypothetical protein
MKNPLLLAIVALAFMEGAAHAQTSNTTDENYSYRFDDEDLLGTSLAASGELIKIRLGPVHTLLIRPRVSFVTELQKSAERF